MTKLTPDQLREARRQFASLGGRKRAEMMTPEQKRIMGQLGAKARWAKKKGTA